MANLTFIQDFLEKSTSCLSWGRETFGELTSIVCLDTLSRHGEALREMLEEDSRRIGAVFLKSLHIAPAGILINGSVLIELLSFRFVNQAGRRDSFSRTITMKAMLISKD